MREFMLPLLNGPCNMESLYDDIRELHNQPLDTIVSGGFC